MSFELVSRVNLRDIPEHIREYMWEQETHSAWVADQQRKLLLSGYLTGAEYALVVTRYERDRAHQQQAMERARDHGNHINQKDSTKT